MSDITTANTTLPAAIDELAQFVLFNRERLTAVKAQIRAIEKLQLAQEVIEQKRAEAHMIAETVLEAEVRLGELFSQLPTNQGKRTDIQRRDSGVPMSAKSKIEIINELGFSKKQAQRLETLAGNRNIFEFVKSEARENGEFPTRARVLELANYQNQNTDDSYIETKFLDMADFEKKQEAEQDEYFAFIDERVKVYKELAKITDLLNRFEITDYRMDALRDNFDAVLTVENELRHIKQSKDKLTQIEIEIRKPHKRKYNYK